MPYNTNQDHVLTVYGNSEFYQTLITLTHASDPSETCPITSDTITVESVFPEMLSLCDMSTGIKFQPVAELVCKHRFSTSAIMFHFFVSEMTCPMCRNGYPNVKLAKPKLQCEWIDYIVSKADESSRNELLHWLLNESIQTTAMNSPENLMLVNTITPSSVDGQSQWSDVRMQVIDMFGIDVNTMDTNLTIDVRPIEDMSNASHAQLYIEVHSLDNDMLNTSRDLGIVFYLSSLVDGRPTFVTSIEHMTTIEHDMLRRNAQNKQIYNIPRPIISLVEKQIREHNVYEIRVTAFCTSPNSQRFSKCMHSKKIEHHELYDVSQVNHVVLSEDNKHFLDITHNQEIDYNGDIKNLESIQSITLYLDDIIV